MKPKDKMFAKLVKDNADVAWKLFFEQGHSDDEYEFCISVIKAAMIHFNSIRQVEEEDDDTL